MLKPKLSSQLVGFYLWNGEKIPRWPFKITFPLNKFVSAISACLLKLFTKQMQEILTWLRTFTNTVYLSWSINRRELYWYWNNIWSLNWDLISLTVSNYHCFDHYFECSSFELISLKKCNLHNFWVGD